MENSTTRPDADSHSDSELSLPWLKVLGLLLLGPHRHYRDHYHPASELYWPLTGSTEWRKGDGTFAVKEAGTAIWHPSMILHAMITHEAPLLTVWSWTRDTATSARLA